MYDKTCWWVVILVVSIGVIASEKCHPHDKRALLRIKQEFFNNSILLEQEWKPNSDCCDFWPYVRCDDTTNRVTLFFVLGSDTPNTPFPSSLGDLPYLEILIFISSNATGPIPSTLSKLRRLTYLDLSNNLLTGPIPSFFESLPDLSKLYLKDNMLHGQIPRSLHRVKFTTFVVSGNRLRGDASFLFGEDKMVVNLDLSRNDFAFNLTGLGLPHEMNTLDLSHNRIYGTLSKALSTLPYLDIFNVSYNRLCGEIPTGGTLTRFDTTSYFHNKCLCGTPLPPCH